MDTGPNRKSRLLFCACLIVSCVLAYQIASWAAQSFGPWPEIPSKNEIGPCTLLTPSSCKIDLGTMPRGGRKEETIHLSNKGNETVEIANIEIGCDCLQMRLPSRVFGPSQETEAGLIADFSSDPNFTGRLGIEVNGRTLTGGYAVKDSTGRMAALHPRKTRRVPAVI